MAFHQGFLVYASLKWAKLSALLVLGAAIAYAVLDPEGGHAGDTVYGYTVGTIAALLVLWLTWFGARKRSYTSGGAPLVGWLSAHVYLGAAVLLLVPLHAGFQLHINVHTLAYLLLVLTVGTGMVGVGLYATLPTSLTKLRSGESFDGVLERIADIDAEARRVAVALPDAISAEVHRSIEATTLGGGALRQLLGRDADCPTARAVEFVARALPGLAEASRLDTEHILELLARKRALVAGVRREAKLQALLDLWLIVHIPAAIATVAAVVIHVIAVFYYR